MKDLKDHYTLKEGSVKEPDQYLGAQVCKWWINDADDPMKTCWAMSSDGYVKQAIAKMEWELEQVDRHLKMKVTTPMTPGY